MSGISRRILITSTVVPGFSNAASVAYLFFERLQQEGYSVHLWHLISPAEEGYYQYLFGDVFGNPGQLANIENINPDKFSLQTAVENLKPDIIVAFSKEAVLALSQVAPDIPQLYLLDGLGQIKGQVRNKRIKDFLEFQSKPRDESKRLKIYDDLEKKALIKCDLAIANSHLLKTYLPPYFPYMIGQVYREAIEWGRFFYRAAGEYKHLRKPFAERTIDLLFVACDWNTAEKNYPLAMRIARSFRKQAVHLIGNIDPRLEKDRVTYHGVVSNRDEFFKILGDSKTVICPALFAAAPGSLYEAVAMGCNIVTSKNCASWAICNEALLVDPFSLRKFREKINLSLQKEFPANIDGGQQDDSYNKLQEIISLF